MFSFDKIGIFCVKDLRIFVTWVYTRKSVKKIKEEWKKRRQYEQFWKEHTGVSSVPYNLLQTYNIFGHVESMLKTKATVDFSLGIFNILKAAFWFILAVSAPGQLRDVTIQVGLLSIVYVVWNFMIALATRSTSKARAASVIFWYSSSFHFSQSNTHTLFLSLSLSLSLS
jgi:hypothetical protein